MNFLSHYYFDRNSQNSYEVLGSILPDLVKNANKHWNIYPDKKEQDYYTSETEQALLKGWTKHLEVDKIFHNTSFFFFHQHQLKNEVKKVVWGTPVKPFFIGHIGLELCLDNLLINQQKIRVNDLYNHLENTDNKQIESFLSKSGIDNPHQFSSFFNSFRKERYLESYSKVNSLSYSIKRICMRIWDKPLSDAQEEELTEILNAYISGLKENFMVIFDEIELQLLND